MSHTNAGKRKAEHGDNRDNDKHRDTRKVFIIDLSGDDEDEDAAVHAGAVHAAGGPVAGGSAAAAHAAAHAAAAHTAAGGSAAGAAAVHAGAAAVHAAGPVAVHAAAAAHAAAGAAAVAAGSAHVDAAAAGRAVSDAQRQHDETVAALAEKVKRAKSAYAAAEAAVPRKLEVDADGADGADGADPSRPRLAPWYKGDKTSGSNACVLLPEQIPTIRGQHIVFEDVAGWPFAVPRGASLDQIAEALAVHVPPGRAAELAKSILACTAEAEKELDGMLLTAVPSALAVFTDNGKLTDVTMLAVRHRYAEKTVSVDLGPDDDDKDDDYDDDDEQERLYQTGCNVHVTAYVEDDWYDAIMYFQDEEALAQARQLMTAADFEKVVAAMKRAKNN